MGIPTPTSESLQGHVDQIKEAEEELAKTDLLLARATEQNRLLKNDSVEPIKEEDEMLNTEGEVTQMTSHRKYDVYEEKSEETVDYFNHTG